MLLMIAVDELMYEKIETITGHDYIFHNIQ